MDFKAAYRRFRQWQQDPFSYKFGSQDSHRCNNCGNEYVGNFCPMCSQKQEVGPITWKSVIQSIGEVWGLHNRSLLYSVVQLFLRPGYFISDYISGKKQVSFPPVKMLTLVSLLGTLVDVLTGADVIGVFKSDFDFQGDKMLFLDNAFEWMNTHPDLMSMIIMSYLIIPVYIIFRFAPRNTHHTLPQCFFIQVFSSVLFLFLNMLYDLTPIGRFVFVLGAVLLYFTYRQLFGYDIWGTVWRLAVTLTCGVLIATIFLFVDFIYHMFPAGMREEAYGLIIITLACVIAYVLILWISYLVSKPRSKKRKPKPTPTELAPAEPEFAEDKPVVPEQSKSTATEPKTVEKNTNAVKTQSP